MLSDDPQLQSRILWLDQATFKSGGTVIEIHRSMLSQHDGYPVHFAREHYRDFLDYVYTLIDE